MKTSAVLALLLAAVIALPAQAEPFPLKLHKKMRGEIHKKLGIDDDRRDRNHRSYRHYDRDRSYHGYYGHDPYYYDPYYRSSIVVQRHYVEEPRVYRSDVEQIPLEQQVQIELAREGYYHGEIDGIIGPQTRDAIRRYQYEEGLRVTGRIDRDLLEELDII